MVGWTMPAQPYVSVKARYHKHEKLKAAASAAIAAVADDLAAHAVRVLWQISRRHQNEPWIKFTSAMGTYFFQVGENAEYRGEGAGYLLDRIDEAREELGWGAVPIGQWYVTKDRKISLDAEF